MTANIAVIFHSRNGTIYALARAAAEGAARSGARVRLLRVADDEPGHPDLSAVRLAGLDDLRWADGIVLGTPTYYGNVSFALKRFIDGTTSMWSRGELADRAVTGLTSATSLHGGREATLLALYHSMYHWGALIVSAGHADPLFASAGGNPYGVSAPALDDGSVGAACRDAARALGGRLSKVAGQLTAPAPIARPWPVNGECGSAVTRTRVAVIYYCTAGSTRALAMAVADGARAAGAEVRLRRVSDLVPEPGFPGYPRAGPWPVRPETEATLTDLEWADAIAFGTPALVGTAAPPLTYFMEAAEPLRAAGRLDGRPVTAFVSAAHEHGGSESALLALYNAMHHWGAIIVPPGYADPSVTTAGGNPYGTSWVATAGSRPDGATRDAARFQGYRLAAIAARLAGGCTGRPVGEVMHVNPG